MAISKKKSLFLGATLALGIALVPAMSASAWTDSGNTYKACTSSAAPYLGVSSTATGRVNHSINDTVLNSWNNGGTSQNRFSYSSSSSGDWRAYLTTPGNITYNNGICSSISS